MVRGTDFDAKRENRGWTGWELDKKDIPPHGEDALGYQPQPGFTLYPFHRSAVCRQRSRTPDPPPHELNKRTFHTASTGGSLCAASGSHGARAFNFAPQTTTPMNRADIYHARPGILGGTPVFTGTRVPVGSLVHHLRAGVTMEAFLDDFQSASHEQAEAFLALALNDAFDPTPEDAKAA